MKAMAMKPQYHLTPLDRRRDAGEVVLPARLACDGADDFELWFKVPERYEPLVTDSCDPFLLAVIFHLLKVNADLHIHGSVSTSLLRNLEEFQSVWICCRPTWYMPVNITADIESNEVVSQSRDPSILAFSGGADSCFTAWRHHRGQCGRSRCDIQAAVMVHGFDIGLDEPEVFQNAFKKARRITESIGVDLLPVATNLTQLDAHWGDSHGAAVVSCLTLVGKRFGSGLIAGSSPYNEPIFPWGSSPVTDWMLGSDRFRIIHDGAAYIRREKMRAIANWPEAMRNLRVCWEGARHDRNCGICEKCIRTVLSFRVMDLPVPPCFEELPDNARIASLTGLHAETLYPLEDILEYAAANGVRQDWVGVLKKCVRKNRRQLSRPEVGLLQRLRRWVALRTRLRKLRQA